MTKWYNKINIIHNYFKVHSFLDNKLNIYDDVENNKIVSISSVEDTEKIKMCVEIIKLIGFKHIADNNTITKEELISGMNAVLNKSQFFTDSIKSRNLFNYTKIFDEFFLPAIENVCTCMYMQFYVHVLFFNFNKKIPSLFLLLLLLLLLLLFLYVHNL